MDSEITIIGGGVIGLAIAAHVSATSRHVCLLEKNERCGTGISSRNSEVIHAGIYYPQGTLKATLCVEGRERLYALCAGNDIPHRKVGKIIIAVIDDEMEELEILHHTALCNGIPSVRMLTKEQVLRMEPNVRAVGGLLSPETGILSVHALMDFYAHRAEANGALISCGTEVTGIEPTAGGYLVRTTNLQGERFEFTTERIINSAGLCSDTIAAMSGAEYKLHYCKGDYFGIADSRRGLVNHLIYPVPEKNHVGLGVHLTLGLDGHMKLGPDTAYIDRTEDFRIDETKAVGFHAGASRFLPFLTSTDVTPEMSGIRPKLQGPGDCFRDFVIREDRPGFINLVGMESPGLTASPAIATYVEGMLR